MVDWDLISFVNASKPRFQILVNLNRKVTTPRDLSVDIGIPISRVSSVLSELSKKKLVECLTPNRRKEKMYGITEFGKKVLNDIHEMTEAK
jgi:DNA-binding MarR family transcriptional regulator